MRTERLPENTDTRLYIPDFEAKTLQDVLDEITKHFGDCDLNDLEIESENIQIACFGYDLYDPLDWSRYLVITKIGG